MKVLVSGVDLQSKFNAQDWRRFVFSGLRFFRNVSCNIAYSSVARPQRERKAAFDDSSGSEYVGSAKFRMGYVTVAP